MSEAGIPTAATERSESAPRQELRLALTLNGGASLAVYIGGVVQELHRLAAPRDGERGYAKLLKLLSIDAVVDVISGTSAGGINGAALAIALASKNGDITPFRSLWIQRGGIEAMVRTPFQSNPPSLLKGDEYFLPELTSAFRQLVSRFDRSDRTLDLTITTTLLNPVTLRTPDHLQTELVQADHAGQFHFAGGPVWSGEDPGGQESDDFAHLSAREGGADDDVVAALALAARATAAFPVAFEPAFVPVGHRTATRPDMARYASWADGHEDRSRFAVDGGVLANTPTKPTLEGIKRMRVGASNVRRVLLLVHPHAVDAATVVDRADLQEDPPSLARGLGGVAGAAGSLGSRSYVDEIERMNALLQGRRDGRAAMLEEIDTPADLFALFMSAANPPRPNQWWQVARALLIERAAQFLAGQLRDVAGLQANQLRAVALKAVHNYPPELPFLPSEPPSRVNVPADGSAGWLWGLDLAGGVAALAVQIAREFIAAADLAGAADLREVALGAFKAFANREIALANIAAEQRDCAIEAFTPVTASSPTEEHLFLYFDGQIELCQRRIAAADDAGDGADPTPGSRVRNEVYAIAELMRGLVAAIPDGSDAVERLLGVLRDTADTQDMVVRLLTIELAAFVVNPAPPTDPMVPSAPIDLVQLSAHVKQEFAPNLTADDKLAGMSLGRFGGFLKRSWRANDWLWGRLDAIKLLMLIVVTPERVRRLAAGPGEAVTVLAALRATVYPDKDLPELVTGLEKPAKRDIEKALQHTAGTSLPSLASYLALGLQLAIMREETASLVDAIGDDREERSAGAPSAGFARAAERYLGREVEWTPELEADMLERFAKSGIGREDPVEQVASDLMIRTAATAAATGATMLSSKRSGLALLRPIGSVLRGLVAVPYWVAVGLTGSGVIGRFLATVGMAVGISFVALGLFGSLPALVATPLTTVGVSSLIAVFAYAAMRARSIIHGAALLGLLVLLIPFAISRIMSTASDSQADGDVTGGSIAAIAVVGLVIGTVVIANVRTPVSSPFAVFTHAWRAVRSTWFRVALSTVVAVVAAGWALVAFTDVESFLWPLVGAQPWSGRALGTAIALFGVVFAVAFWLGRWWSRRLRPFGGAGPGVLADPAGLAIAWSGAYACGYAMIALAVVLVLGIRHQEFGGVWLAPALSFALAVAFLAAIPVMWRRRRMRLIGKLIASRVVIHQAWSAVPAARRPDTDINEIRSGFSAAIRDELIRIGERSDYYFADAQAALSAAGIGLARDVFGRMRGAGPDDSDAAKQAGARVEGKARDWRAAGTAPPVRTAPADVATEAAR